MQDIAQRESELSSPEQMLGKGALMPFTPMCSGSRRILQSTQTEQVHVVTEPEMPILQTGFENQFGEYSSSFIRSDADLRVVKMISKYTFNNLHFHDYVLIVQNMYTGEYDVLHRKPYSHITETFGCIYDNRFIDSIAATFLSRYGHIENDYIVLGDMANAVIIPETSVIQKSTAFDDSNNRCDGVNLLCGYIAKEHTKEDSIVISASAAKKLGADMINLFSIHINDNDIPLNLYGGDVMYKIFPDVGEVINGGVLCALRRENNEHMLYSQTYERLKNLFVSDDVYYGTGIVCDVDVYSNNPDILDNEYYKQLKYYHDDKMRFNQELVNIREVIKKSSPLAKISPTLSKMFVLAKKIIEGVEYINKNKQFSNIILKITTIKHNDIMPSDKITNRFGGKGCVSEIVPDEMMPMLDNGKRLECAYTPPSVINRNNLGILFEQSVNFITDRILENFKQLRDKNGNKVGWSEPCWDTYLELLSTLSDKLFDYIHALYKAFEPHERDRYINNLIEDDAIVISLDNISEVLDIDKLAYIYEKFDIPKYKVMVPIKNSRGEYRYVQARREIVASRVYIWRLKQYSEDKVSAVSLASTNIRGENSKSNSKKMNKTIFSKTCIRFGNMETGNLLHLSPEVVITNLMINSASPNARRSFVKMLHGNVFNIDMKLEPEASNRGVEIVNTKLATIGLRLQFIKKPKFKKPLFVKNEDLFTPIYDPLFTDYDKGVVKLFEDIGKPLPLFKGIKTPLFTPCDKGKDKLFEEMR